MLLWLGINESGHHSTATSAKTQLHIAGSPEKASELFFFCFWISHCQLCELPRPGFGGNIQRCLLERTSQRWNPELRSRSHNGSTGAVLVRRAVRLLHAKSREERINLELRLCELLLGSTVLGGHDFFLKCSHAQRERKREREREREKEREREREYTKITDGLTFSVAFSTFRGGTRETRSAGERSLERQSAPWVTDQSRE